VHGEAFLADLFRRFQGHGAHVGNNGSGAAAREAEEPQGEEASLEEASPEEASVEEGEKEERLVVGHQVLLAAVRRGG